MSKDLQAEFAKARWRKSIHSGDGECVEVALVEDAVGVRDSKNPAGPSLVFTTGEWSAFIKGVKSGEFDH